MPLPPMTSDSQEWRTPRRIFDPLDEEFHFALDAASTNENKLCRFNLTIEDDALSVPWSGYGGPVWLNSPYGRGLSKWVRKAQKEGEAVTVVMLMFAATDTHYWHKHIMAFASEVRLIHGRVSFLLPDGRSSGPAPKGSAIIVFDPKDRIESWTAPLPRFSSWKP